MNRAGMLMPRWAVRNREGFEFVSDSPFPWKGPFVHDDDNDAEFRARVPKNWRIVSDSSYGGEKWSAARVRILRRWDEADPSLRVGMKIMAQDLKLGECFSFGDSPGDIKYWFWESQPGWTNPWCGENMPKYWSWVTNLRLLKGMMVHVVPHWRTMSGVDAEFPHVCPHCSGPAYIGANRIHHKRTGIPNVCSAH